MLLLQITENEIAAPPCDFFTYAMVQFVESKEKVRVTVMVKIHKIPERSQMQDENRNSYALLTLKSKEIGPHGKKLEFSGYPTLETADLAAMEYAVHYWKTREEINGFAK